MEMTEKYIRHCYGVYRCKRARRGMPIPAFEVYREWKLRERPQRVKRGEVYQPKDIEMSKEPDKVEAPIGEKGLRDSLGNLRALWVGVLHQAILDVQVFESKNSVSKQEIVCANEAWGWIHSRSRKSIYDCAEICSIAGISHDRVKRFVAHLRCDVNYHIRRVGALASCEHRAPTGRTKAFNHWRRVTAGIKGLGV
jgi:hypothetical protein